MATKVHKKELIRKQIIEAANIYSHKLAGKKFLYVTPNYYFEILFLTDKFLHLTGVNTKLTAKDFYEKARKGILQNNQFYFDKEHPFDIAKNKLPNLIQLPELTTKQIYIINNLKTLTLVYRYGLTNFNFTLGLTEYIDKKNNIIKETFIPRTLRSNDNAPKYNTDNLNCNVSFIFEKDASKRIYTTLLFREYATSIPLNIKHLIDSSFYE